MKTKEEIEQLAKQLCNIPIDLVIDEEERYYKNFQKFDGIVLGYTQCQEDMADKKYTEEDMIDAIIYGSSLTTSNIKLYAHNYINSLNKQDNG
jgi:hypothetical protein